MKPLIHGASAGSSVCTRHFQVKHWMEMQFKWLSRDSKLNWFRLLHHCWRSLFLCLCCDQYPGFLSAPKNSPVKRVLLADQQGRRLSTNTQYFHSKCDFYLGGGSTPFNSPSLKKKFTCTNAYFMYFCKQNCIIEAFWLSTHQQVAKLSWHLAPLSVPMQRRWMQGFKNATLEYVPALADF